MAEPSSFAEMMQRVRAGDQDAAAELVRRYEPAIRRVVRYRMGDAHLAAVLDSVDICQSVLASFFVRAVAGRFDLDGPEQLQKLLLAMARNKVAFQVRKQHAQCRGGPGAVSGSLDEGLFVDPQPSPSQQVAAQDLLREVQHRLSEEEWQLVQLRTQGLGWDEIAAQLHVSPEALRKRLTRAGDRVAHEMGLDDWTDE
jgi:RNA polymerase sigma-70 factor (ECF subfamily)